MVSKGRCQSCWHKEHYQENKDAIKKAARIVRLRKHFGITEEQWDKMYDRQEGRCPICLKPIPRAGAKGRKGGAVDHDHKTKRVRGLVCHICNRWRIGKNDAATAQRVLDYVSSDFDGRLL